MPHPTPIAVRQLGAANVDLFRELLGVFGEAFEDTEAYLRSQPSDAYLESLLNSDHFITLAAWRDGSVIGGLAAYELKKFEQQRSEIYIYDLAVLAQHRRKGAGAALIAQLKAIAKSRGAYVIFVQADLTDAPAIAFYAKLGTREDVLHFDIAAT